MKAIQFKEKIQTWVEAMKKGAYGNSREIVDIYNAIFEGIKPKQNYTTCGSCLRRCINTMATQLNAELQLLAEEQKAKEQEKKNEELIEETPITDLAKEIKKTIKNKKNND